MQLKHWSTHFCGTRSPALAWTAACTLLRQSRLPKCFGWRQSHQQGPLRSRRYICVTAYAGWLTVHVRQHPREVCPLARRGVPPIRPITGRPSLPPSSSTRCPVREPYDSPCCRAAVGRRAYHVPQVEPSGWFRSRLSAGGAASAPGKFGIPGPDHVPFGPSLILQPPWGGHDYRRTAAAPLACPV
jgi:hypothetical protein